MPRDRSKRTAARRHPGRRLHAGDDGPGRDANARRLRRRRDQDRAPADRRPVAHLHSGRSGRARRPGLLLAQSQQALGRARPEKPEERAALIDLIRGADVVVNNFRAGVMERMGLGYDELKKTNPRLIYAVGTGFGVTGPYAHKGGQDVLERHDLCGLLGGHAPGPGRAARVAATGEDGTRTAVQRVIARLDDRRADPGSDHATDAWL